MGMVSCVDATASTIIIIIGYFIADCIEKSKERKTK